MGIGTVSMKRKLTLVCLVLICLVSAVAVILSAKSRRAARPNVLFISACSLRQDRLGIYNRAATRSPNLDRWSQGAGVIFDNAIAERPWENFIFESDETITRSFLNDNGYER